MIAPQQSLYRLIALAKARLDAERVHGDGLRIDLAEATLNDLLDRLARERKI